MSLPSEGEKHEAGACMKMKMSMNIDERATKAMCKPFLSFVPSRGIDDFTFADLKRSIENVEGGIAQPNFLFQRNCGALTYETGGRTSVVLGEIMKLRCVCKEDDKAKAFAFRETGEISVHEDRIAPTALSLVTKYNCPSPMELVDGEP